MKYLIIFLALGAMLACCFSFPVRRSDFECPPPDLIHPCECSTSPRKMVKCDDVKNLEIVRRALENRFSGPLPKLQISNVHAFTLPHQAFRNISAKKLVLNGSNIRRIHDDAFDGQGMLGLLVLSEDRLTEFPTQALSRLSGLRTLSLAGNFLMRIGDQCLENLRNLKHLVLSDNRISRIERNAFPRALESLFISRNLLTTLNGTVNNLSQLEILFVRENRLTTVKGELEGLTQLNHLALDGNKISDIDDSFSDLVSLKRLNLAYNNLEKIDEGLYPLTKLRYLNVSYNYITELDEELFVRLNGLEILDLSGNYLKTICPQLTPLKALRELNLSDTNQKSLDHDCFEGMKSLQVLDLSQNGLTNIDAVTLHPLPKMMFLYIQDNALLTIKHGFKNLRNLYELDVSVNDLSSLKGQHLTHNRMLKIVKLGGNDWECTDHLIHVLRDLESRMIEVIDKPLCYLSDNAL